MKSNEQFYKRLAYRESGGTKNPYATVNPYGYTGKYQVGTGILIELGYYKGANNNDWKGKFTGKNGVNSYDDFKNNKNNVQEIAVKEEMKYYWGKLKNNGATDYVGQVIGEDVITPSGLLAGAHLKGPTGMLNYLKDPQNLNNKDGFDTKVSDYVHFMGHCDVMEETNNYTYDRKEAESR